jgi:predicted nucleic acid-binding protein
MPVSWLPCTVQRIDSTRLVRTGVLAAPALLLPEVAGVISRRTTRPDLGTRVIQRLEALEELTLVPFGRALNQLAAELAANLSIGGTDACYVALALRESLPLATWDRQQRERSTEQIEVQTPETLLVRAA